MIKGIRIKLINRSITDYDDFNAPIYTETSKYVDNVLVSPTSSDDVISQMDLTGRMAVYTIAIPKGNTDVWEDQYVEFFGHRFHVFSAKMEGIEEMIPLSWNAKYYVERYEH